LGPSSNLGRAIGQTLVEMQWKGIRSEDELMAIQKREPYLVALGREDQRGLLQ